MDVAAEAKVSVSSSCSTYTTSSFLPVSVLSLGSSESSHSSYEERYANQRNSPVEIMNTAIRAKATAMVNMAAWISNFMIGQVSPKAFANIGEYSASVLYTNKQA